MNEMQTPAAKGAELFAIRLALEARNQQAQHRIRNAPALAWAEPIPEPRLRDPEAIRRRPRPPAPSALPRKKPAPAPQGIAAFLGQSRSMLERLKPKPAEYLDLTA